MPNEQGQSTGEVQTSRSQKDFQVRRWTLGRDELLGLIEVISDVETGEDGKARVTVRELPDNGRECQGLLAGTIRPISNKPGSAKNSENPEESEYEMASRLAGRERKTRHEYLYAASHGNSDDVVRATFKAETGQLYLQIKMVSQKGRADEVNPTFRLIRDVTEKEGGNYVTRAEWLIEVKPESNE